LLATIFIHTFSQDSDLVMGWTVRRSNPSRGRDLPHPFRPALRPTEPAVKWALGLFSGNKQPRRRFDHPRLSSVEVKEIVEL